MIGGGNNAKQGEIARANGGLLVLDEMLEFNPIVLESLREPLEDGLIRISRGGVEKIFLARFQFMATSNLCPCGDWSPLQPKINCRFPQKKCRSYSTRISGPLMDRFQMIYFTSGSIAQKGKNITQREVFERVMRAVEFQKRRGQLQMNAWAEIGEIEATVDRFVLNNLLPEKWSSLRRRQAVLRVARTLADLASEEMVLAEHLQQALVWTVHNFESLQRW
jgi:magnesium chelatase family protein